MSAATGTRRITHAALEGATKLFGAVRALSGIHFEITAGQVAAVMGANGAGKSTLLSLLSLCARPTRGSVRFNRAPVADPARLRHAIGLLSHDAMVYPDLTARENLLLFARLYGVPSPAARVDALAEQMDICGFGADRPARVLSRGQLQRVALARALIHRPDLLLLDEPAAGLDSCAVARIEAVIKDHVGRDGMAVVVTHEPEVAARIATRAVMMARGRVVADRPAPEDAVGWRACYFDAMGREQ